MNFIFKYPNSSPGEEVREGLVRLDYVEKSFICAEETLFWELNYDAPFCCDECLEEMHRRAAK